MTTSTAIYLAEQADKGNAAEYSISIADELWRLESVNTQLLEACIEALTLFDNHPQCYEELGTLEVLQAAIAKAFGKKSA
jgi:hypothetical protein